MATAGDIVTRALRLIKVYGAGETPSAEDMADGLADLNEMLFAWQNTSLAVNHTTVTATDTLNVPDSYLKAIRYALAVELAPQYGADPAAIFVGQATVAQIALDELSHIRGVQRIRRDVTTDLDMCNMSIQSRTGWLR